MNPDDGPSGNDIQLAQLEIPRKHYQTYYRTKSANSEIIVVGL